MGWWCGDGVSCGRRHRAPRRGAGSQFVHERDSEDCRDGSRGRPRSRHDDHDHHDADAGACGAVCRWSSARVEEALRCESQQYRDDGRSHQRRTSSTNSATTLRYALALSNPSPATMIRYACPNCAESILTTPLTSPLAMLSRTYQPNCHAAIAVRPGHSETFSTEPPAASVRARKRSSPGGLIPEWPLRGTGVADVR